MKSNKIKPGKPKIIMDPNMELHGDDPYFIKQGERAYKLFTSSKGFLELISGQKDKREKTDS